MHNAGELIFKEEIVFYFAARGSSFPEAIIGDVISLWAGNWQIWCWGVLAFHVFPDYFGALPRKNNSIEKPYQMSMEPNHKLGQVSTGYINTSWAKSLLSIGTDNFTRYPQVWQVWAISSIIIAIIRF